MGLDRRELLKFGVLGSAALALPFERTARTKLKQGDLIRDRDLPRPFQHAFATPAVLGRCAATPRVTTTRSR